MLRSFRHLSLFAICVSCIGVSACSTTPQAVRTSPANTSADIYDPIEGFNRKVFVFNGALDRYFIGPLARGYAGIMPTPIRKGINNAARNIGEPVIFANQVLQLDAKDARDSLGRFMVNSTFGLGGFIDVAAKEGLPQDNEDFGQTLATYNVPAGPYLVLPFLGPSNLRDIGGRLGDGAMNPVRIASFNGDKPTQIGRRISNGLDARIRAEEFLGTVGDSADPYIKLRGVYTQNQLSNIHEDADAFSSDDTDDGFDDGFADFE